MLRISLVLFKEDELSSDSKCGFGCDCGFGRDREKSLKCGNRVPYRG